MSNSIYNEQKRTIYTVSAECGRGKTYSMSQYVKAWKSDKNQLIVAPSIDLIDEIKNQLEEDFNVYPDIIHNKNTVGTVNQAVVQYFKDATHSNKVLIITFESFSKLTYFHNRENWTVYVDEIPQIDHLRKIKLTDNPTVLTNVLKLDDQVNDNLSKLIPVDPRKFNYIIDKGINRDDTYKAFEKLLRDIHSPYTDVFVDRDKWSQLLNNKKTNDEEIYIVYALSMMNPRLMDGVTLMGANFQYSMLYHWFSSYHNVEFKEHRGIVSNLLEPIDYTGRLKCSYFFKDKKWSKNLRNRLITAEGKKPKRVHQIIDDVLCDKIVDAPFLFNVNNDYSTDDNYAVSEEDYDFRNYKVKWKLMDLKGCEHIPVVTKGINKYSEYTTVVYLPALNRAPYHQSMLTSLGLDFELVTIATSYENLYQTLMRTALRTSSSNSVVELICATEEECDFIISIIGESEKKRITDIEYKKYKPLSPVENNQRSDLRKVTKLLILEEGEHDYTSGEVYATGDNSFIKGTIIKTHFSSTFLTNYYHNYPTPRIPYLMAFHTKLGNSIFASYSPTEFRSEMEGFSKTLIDNKEDMFFINPSVYEGDESTSRSYDRYLQSSMLILDFDSGELGISEIENLFWNEAKRGSKRSFIICNSYSRSPDDPNRFRVFLPFKAPVTSIEQYKAAYNLILQQILDAGYTVNSSGIDTNSEKPTQAYWIPCTNRDYPDQHYFQSYGWKTRDLERCSIDPDDLQIEQIIEPIFGSAVPKVVSIEKDKKVMTWLEQRKQKITSMSEGRRKHFYSLCEFLFENGFDYYDINQHLSEVEHSIGKTGWTKSAMKYHEKKEAA